MRLVENKCRWSLEPSYCYPPCLTRLAPTAANDAYHRAMESTFFNEMSRSTPVSLAQQPTTFETFDHLFGTDPPVSRAQPWFSHTNYASANRSSLSLASDELETPASTSLYRLQLSDRMGEFNRTQRNLFGCSTVSPTRQPVNTSSEFSKTKRNLFGPHSPIPVRFSVKRDGFNETQRNLFGPATAPIFRLPRRTSDFEQTRAHLFGPDPPFIARFSQRPSANTHENLFGEPTQSEYKALPKSDQLSTEDILSMTGGPDTARKYHPRPENSFSTTFQHVIRARMSPLCHKQQFRTKDDSFNKLFGQEIDTARQRGKQLTKNTFATVFGRGLTIPDCSTTAPAENTFDDIFSIKRPDEQPVSKLTVLNSCSCNSTAKLPVRDDSTEPTPECSTSTTQ